METLVYKHLAQSGGEKAQLQRENKNSPFAAPWCQFLHISLSKKEGAHAHTHTQECTHPTKNISFPLPPSYFQLAGEISKVALLDCSQDLLR